jgi:hypothetical protein
MRSSRAVKSFLNHAPIIGLSIAAVVGFMGLSPQSATAATFTPVIEEFQIIRDNVSIFLDPFGNGTLPTVEAAYSVTGPAGMTSESGGRLTMTPALGDPTSGVGTADTITRALRLASTDPNSPNHLGQANQVQVRGLFNIALPNTLPTINGQNFGIRLQDGSLTTPTNGVASLSVGRNLAGDLRVRFHEASTNQTVDTFNIESYLVGAAFVELIISKAADSANPTATFRILDALMGVLLQSAVMDNINDVTGQPLALYDGEAFARAAFYSTDADAVPLPAALPLFATILAGGGLIAWRRRRKAAQQKL